MMNPKISVIIPVYNVENYLEETLNNITNQTFFENTEVLLVDDGSTDNSGHIVDKYASDYDNIYAFHKVNEGQCVARNFALSHVKGEYIHFMDSDDLIKYNAYEKLYAFAKKGNYDVVTFNYLRFDEEKTWKVANQQDVFDEFDGDIENTNLSEFKELCWDMTNCNKIVKKELLDTKNISYHHKNILYEDNLLWIEIYFNAERIGILKEYLYFWRYRNDLTSTTQTYDLDLGNKLFEMVYLVNEFLKENITDKSILYKKYEKLLTINLYFFIVAIQSYPKEHQESLLENAYDMANVVPSDIYTNLNTYFQVLYMMVNNKDWDALLRFLSYNFKRNPKLPEDFDEKYIEKLHFNRDSYSEKLESTAKNVSLEDDNIVIEFENFVPYNQEDNFNSVNFKLLKNSKEYLLDSKYIKGNKLYISVPLLGIGENKIISICDYNDIIKKSFMHSEVSEAFDYENYEITIKKGFVENLILIKREKDDTNLIIENVDLIDNKLFFKGTVNKRLESILMIDYLGILKFSYPLNYLSENEIVFEINCDDLFRVPIKKWELTSYEKFNKINISQKYEFFKDNHLISIKNHKSKIFIEITLNKTSEENNKNTNSIKIENRTYF